MTSVYAVQLISFLRLLAALIFAGLAFESKFLPFVMSLYIFAIISDLLDGYLSRKLEVVTYFGKVIDLVADKSLSIISLLYGAACGIDMLPLAMIAVRDLVMIGMRLIILDKTQLLPTSRIFGGIMSTVLWGNTLFLMYARHKGLILFANIIYWFCSIIFIINLVIRIHRSAARIKVALLG